MIKMIQTHSKIDPTYLPKYPKEISGDLGFFVFSGKIHLFDAPFTGLVESQQTLAGAEVGFEHRGAGKNSEEIGVIFHMFFPYT